MLTCNGVPVKRVLPALGYFLISLMRVVVRVHLVGCNNHRKWRQLSGVHSTRCNSPRIRQRQRFLRLNQSHVHVMTSAGLTLVQTFH
jgi:hypothetical protein